MLTDSQAAQLVYRALPSHDPDERLLIQALGRHESSYGAGWKGDGIGSNNWGAVTGVGPAGSFQYRDSRYDANTGKVIEYVTSFRKYPTPESGIQDAANIALRANVRQALRQGDLYSAVAAMRDNRYFLGTVPRDQAIEAYYKRLRNYVRNIVPAAVAAYPNVLRAPKYVATANSEGTRLLPSALPILAHAPEAIRHARASWYTVYEPAVGWRPWANTTGEILA